MIREKFQRRFNYKEEFPVFLLLYERFKIIIIFPYLEETSIFEIWKTWIKGKARFNELSSKFFTSSDRNIYWGDKRSITIHNFVYIEIRRGLIYSDFLLHRWILSSLCSRLFEDISVDLLMKKVTIKLI